MPEALLAFWPLSSSAQTYSYTYQSHSPAPVKFMSSKFERRRDHHRLLFISNCSTAHLFLVLRSYILHESSPKTKAWEAGGTGHLNHALLELPGDAVSLLLRKAASDATSISLLLHDKVPLHCLHCSRLAPFSVIHALQEHRPSFWGSPLNQTLWR